MALGGGSFVTQNKILPGSYINIVSASIGDVFGGRGTGALLVQSDWGLDEPIEISKQQFLNDCLNITGHSYSEADELVMLLADFFKNGSRLIYMPLCSGGAKAQCSYAQATHWGERGNSIRLDILNSVDGGYEVITYIDNIAADKQSVKNASELMDNAFVEFKKDAELNASSGIKLTGGASEAYDGAALQKALGKLESRAVNTAALVDDNEVMQRLVLEWTKRLRDENGKKLCCVLYGKGLKPDYEGAVLVRDMAIGNNPAGVSAWVCGAMAGAQVNQSLTNKIYDGSLLKGADYTQNELEQFIENGVFAFHRVGSDYRVLMDINSLVETTADKGDIFKDNQTVRICDQIATDIAELFNSYYLGKVPNDEAGRSAFKSAVVKHHNRLMSLRAIEDFSSEDISVEQGESKHSVVVNDCILLANAMTKLYMTVRVE